MSVFHPEYEAMFWSLHAVFQRYKREGFPSDEVEKHITNLHGALYMLARNETNLPSVFEALTEHTQGLAAAYQALKKPGE